MSTAKHAAYYFTRTPHDFKMWNNRKGSIEHKSPEVVYEPLWMYNREPKTCRPSEQKTKNKLLVNNLTHTQNYKTDKWYIKCQNIWEKENIHLHLFHLHLRDRFKWFRGHIYQQNKRIFDFMISFLHFFS